ncbi:glycosyltransferase family 39 protein [Candidatus Gottesmanbacteria bacterium]|nr:glycosyltransferase family 39 protein [Candidatus Gottesmanbacteria bacterium]
MESKLTKKNHLLLHIILIALVSFATYFRTWNIYFQQDEWNGFGKVLYANAYGFAALVRLSGNHLTPLAALFMGFFYNTFGLRHEVYAVYGIVLHTVNGLLVYFLARMLTKNTTVSLLSALLLVSFHVSSQVVTWYAASMTYLPSGFFVLVSLLLFELYVKKQKVKYLASSLFFILVAAGFRENAVFVLGYMILRTYLVSAHQFRRVFVFASSIGFVYGIVRFLPMFIFRSSMPLGVQSFDASSFFEKFTHSVFLSIPELIVPRNIQIDSIFWLLSRNRHIHEFFSVIVPNLAVFIETTLVPMLSVVIFTTCCMVTMYVLKVFYKKLNEKKLIYSLYGFILLSFMPFLLLPKGLYMESRHFYLSTIGLSILVGVFFHDLYHRVSLKLKSIIGVFFILISLRVNSPTLCVV